MVVGDLGGRRKRHQRMGPTQEEPTGSKEQCFRHPRHLVGCTKDSRLGWWVTHSVGSVGSFGGRLVPCFSIVVSRNKSFLKS